MPRVRRDRRHALTVSEAARLLGHSPDTIVRLCDAGILPYARMPGLKRKGWRWIQRCHVEAFARQHGLPLCNGSGETLPVPGRR